jgi:hypothetical protein
LMSQKFPCENWEVNTGGKLEIVCNQNWIKCTVQK